jgi:hypothetical protein
MGLKSNPLILKRINLPSISFGGSAGAALALFGDLGLVFEPHFIFVEFCFRGYVFVAGNSDGRSHSFIDELECFVFKVEAVFFDDCGFAFADHGRGLDNDAVDSDLAFAAGVSGQGPAFEDADAPEPFVDTYFVGCGHGGQ